MLAEGQSAPEFSLLNTVGVEVAPISIKAKYKVIYFYPKDDTPGCTIEACSFRDSLEDLASKDIKVFGISADDGASHASFAKKHNLNFELLSDTDKKVIKMYDAWGKKMFGVEGILRKTYVLDADNKIIKIYKKAVPLGHADKIIKDIDEYKKSNP